MLNSEALRRRRHTAATQTTDPISVIGGSNFPGLVLNLEQVPQGRLAVLFQHRHNKFIIITPVDDFLDSSS